MTQVLEAVGAGEEQAAEKLLPLVYAELRRLAAAKMARESPGQTLQPTALVHEAWLRLTLKDGQQWQNRGHFFAAAAEAMRRILVERARRRKVLARGGFAQRTELTDSALQSPAADEELLAVHEALDGLAAQDPRAAEVVKLRYFVGMNPDHTRQTSLLHLSCGSARWTRQEPSRQREPGVKTP